MPTRTPSRPATAKAKAKAKATPTPTPAPAPAPKAPPQSAPMPALKSAVNAPAGFPVAPSKHAKSAKPALATKTIKTPKPAKTPKPQKAPKAPKLRSKPVRDSFTMPEADFALIATLKARTLAMRRSTKKSELLRAGLHALAAMDAAALLAALNQLEPIKVGRPSKGG